MFLSQGGAVVNGLAPTMAKLQNVIREAGYRSTDGMVAWLEHVRKDMDITPPLIPQDTEEMSDSWYIFVGNVGYISAIEAGFTAPYTPYVHERLDPSVQWSRPMSGPKFFEKSIDRNMPKLFSSIAYYANVHKINPNAPARPARTGYRAGSIVEL